VHQNAYLREPTTDEREARKKGELGNAAAPGEMREEFQEGV